MGPNDLTTDDWTRRQLGSRNLGLPNGDPLEYWPMISSSEPVVTDPSGEVEATLPRMNCLIAAIFALVDLPL